MFRLLVQPIRRAALAKARGLPQAPVIAADDHSQKRYRSWGSAARVLGQAAASFSSHPIGVRVTSDAYG